MLDFRDQSLLKIYKMHGPPYLVDLFVSVFHSFEPGIIDSTISRSNDDFYSFLNISSSKFNHLTNHANWASTTNFIIHFSDILFRLNRPRTEILNDGLDLYCLGKINKKSTTLLSFLIIGYLF